MSKEVFSAPQASTFRNVGTTEEDFGEFQKNSENFCDESLEDEILQINDITEKMEHVGTSFAQTKKKQ